MGHAITILTFPENVDEKKAWAEVDEFCRENCDPCEHGGAAPSGLARPIKWKREVRVFATFEEAEDFLTFNRDRLPYEPWAVRYRAETKPSSRTKMLEERVERLEREFKDLWESTLPSKRKARYITCPYCGSSLSRTLLDAVVKCPLCLTDLRSRTSLKRIAAKDAARMNAKVALMESKERDRRKTEVRWAVIAEVHC